MVQSLRTILIVDDSPEDRELYRRYLLQDRAYSYTIWEASLGSQGLAMWQQYQPDVLLLDYHLPDIDGLRFLARLQPLVPYNCLPVIMVTGQGNEAIAVQAMKAGAQDYLVKGQITAQELRLAVDGAIETMQLRIQLEQRIARERIVGQITQKIHQSLELAEILQTTVDQVRQFLQSDRVLIFRMQSDGCGIVTTESVGNDWTALLSSSLSDPCFNEKYITSFQNGLVTIKPDIYDGSINPCHVELLAKLQVRANLVVPILQNEKLWGLLIAHHCSAPKQWQSLEIDLLKELATQLGIALQQAELYRQAQEDLNERRRIEAALRESEVRNDLTMTVARMFSFEWEPTTDTVKRSTHCSPILGLTGIEVQHDTGKKFFQRIHPDDRERFTAILNSLTPTNNTYQTTYRVVCPDGTVITLEETASAEFDEAGHLQHLSGITVDVTERQRMAVELQANQVQLQRQLAELESIYKSAPIGLGVLDRDLRFVRINQRLADINGLSIEAHIGRTVREVLPDLADTAESLLVPILQTGEPLFNVEIHGKTPAQPDVERIWLENFLPLKKDNRVIGISIVCEEITERIQVQRVIQESEQRLQMALEASEGGFWDWDIVNSQHYVNANWLKMLGYSSEDFSHNYSDWESLIHPDDRRWVLDLLQAHLQNDTVPYKFEYRLLTKSGEWKWIANYGKVIIRDADGKPLRMAGVHYDVNERKQAEVERARLLEYEQAARAEAERANRIKDEFLAILSHELRSPLNPILGWSKLLQTSKFDSDKTATALEAIERNAKLLTQLIDDMLDIAKILRGKLSITVAPVNLAFIIREALETVRPAAISKSITINTILPSTLLVVGDAVRLQQIIWNLLSNAIKFTPDRGQVDVQLSVIDCPHAPLKNLPTLSEELISSEIDAQKELTKYAQIIVSDNGKGIKPDFLPYIFESFRQEDASTTRKYGGLGLGLAIVRYLVEAHGGAIQADSPGEGQGATFTMLLPLLDANLTEEQNKKLLKQEFSLSGLRILTVDDEPDTRQLITAVLAQYGAEVLAVESVSQVLKDLDNFQPDVLISDIGMPSMDGYTLIRLIRSLPSEKKRQLPAIALTAYASEDDQRKVLKSGFNWHITKPIEPEQLARAILALTRSKHKQTYPPNL